ncbi:MAG: hypothetical protein HGA67_04525 [Candidatus Yonathbacteria bacterium]|nr:hypothetical protein [Candidatus Yonathbacteria bacterium]
MKLSEKGVEAGNVLSLVFSDPTGSVFSVRVDDPEEIRIFLTEQAECIVTAHGDGSFLEGNDGVLDFLIILKDS